MQGLPHTTVASLSRNWLWPHRAHKRDQFIQRAHQHIQLKAAADVGRDRGLEHGQYSITTQVRQPRQRAAYRKEGRTADEMREVTREREANRRRNAAQA